MKKRDNVCLLASIASSCRTIMTIFLQNMYDIIIFFHLQTAGSCCCWSYAIISGYGIFYVFTHLRVIKVDKLICAADPFTFFSLSISNHKVSLLQLLGSGLCIETSQCNQWGQCHCTWKLQMVKKDKKRLHRMLIVNQHAAGLLGAHWCFGSQSTLT